VWGQRPRGTVWGILGISVQVHMESVQVGFKVFSYIYIYIYIYIYVIDVTLDY
jgi:hypothetical protein